MKKYFLHLILLFSLIYLSFPSSSQAANIENYKTIELRPEQTISNNLYAISPDVLIAGEVEGDLITISPNINISGRINGDLIAISENINITGEINGNLRVFAKKLVINGIVARNVNFIGQDFIIADKGEIGGSVIGRSVNNQIHGLVSGDVDLAADNNDLSGIIAGSLKLRTQKDAYLNISPKSIIGGNLFYQTGLKVNRQDGSQINGLSYELPTKNLHQKSLFDWWQITIYKIISGYIIALLLIKIKRKHLLKLNGVITDKIWPSFFWGLTCLTLSPLVIVLLSISIVALPLAIILTCLFIAILIASKVIIAIFLGLAILKYSKIENKKNLYLAAILGLTVLALLVAIPIIGWVISILASSLTIGLILINSNK